MQIPTAAATFSYTPLRPAVDAVIDAGRVRIRALTATLRTGGMPLHTWEDRMHRELKDLHGAVAMAAMGGPAEMSPADWGFVGSALKRQYQYLGQFAADIASGSQPLGGMLLVRADLYADAARGTFTAAATRSAQQHGLDEGIRLLTPADHCDGCEATADEWMSLEELPPIGSQECGPRCRCLLDYRRGGEGAASE